MKWHRPQPCPETTGTFSWRRSRRPRWGGSPQCSRSPTASWYWPQGLKRLQSRDSFMESEQLTDIFVKSILIYWLYCILIRSTLWGRHIICRVIMFEVRETKRSCDSTFRQEYNFHVLNEHMIFLTISLRFWKYFQINEQCYKHFMFHLLYFIITGQVGQEKRERWEIFILFHGEPKRRCFELVVFLSLHIQTFLEQKRSH